jgi:NAD(P)-dependent dehydrogenase (short-subunit alcohol dehydrogenase family)
VNVLEQFRLTDKHALLTGGGGVLGAAFARALAQAGATVHITDLNGDAAARVANELCNEGLSADAHALNALDRDALARATVDLPTIDILVNAAGGNAAAATTGPDQSFFDLPLPAFEKVIALNLFGGALLPSQVFGRQMAEHGGGVIINVSSMNAVRPLTRIPGYSAAKAAVSNFTQWLATHLAQEYNPHIRVNAVAPGFFLTEQNRYLLVNEATGAWTPRGKQILAHTPAGRFGAPEDLAGALVWLCSDAAAFVTGVVLPIDGGFSAYSGV